MANKYDLNDFLKSYNINSLLCWEFPLDICTQRYNIYYTYLEVMSPTSEMVPDPHGGIKAWWSLELFHELQGTQVLCHLVTAEMTWCSAQTRKSGLDVRDQAPGWGSSLIRWSWASTPTSLDLSLPIHKTGRRGVSRPAVSHFDFGWEPYFFSNKIRSWSSIYEQRKMELVCLKWKWGSETCPFATPFTSLTPTYVCAHILAHVCTCTHACTHAAAAGRTPPGSTNCQLWTQSSLDTLPAPTCPGCYDSVYFDSNCAWFLSSPNCF